MKLFLKFGTVTLKYSDNARNQILKGVKQVRDAAAITLGPQGRNVVIESETASHRITKDGVTVVKNVMLHDRTQELGAALIRQSSNLTNKFAGDGTTTSALIAATIFEQGQRYISSGHNPIYIARGIKEGQKRILEYLEEIKTTEIDDQLLYSVAKLSSNYDEIISECVFRAIKEVGINGQVSIEPGGKETQLKITSGISINRGLMHEQFADKGTTSLTLNYPYIYTTLTELKHIKQIIPLLELIKTTNQSLFIIAPDISSEVMSQLLYNHTKDIIRVGAITVPGFGQFTSDIIQDFSIICDSSLNHQENNINLKYLGQAVKIEITPQETIIIGTSGRQELIDDRKCQLLNELKSINSSGVQILKDRINRFGGKSAILYVGGNSEVELHENRDKMIDSLNATKNTIINGVLPGGGAALLHASKLLDFVTLDNQSEQLGITLLKSTLQQPIKQLCYNSGINGGQLINILLQETDYNMGYDQKQQCLGNMLDLGVVDSFKVIKQALEDGISLGSMLLTTEVAIIQDYNYTPTELKKYKKKVF